MAGAEFLAQFAPMTNLYIADAELDYGDGWDYTASLGTLDQSPGISLNDFGKLEVSQREKQHLADRGEDGDEPRSQDDVLKRTQAAFGASRWPNVQAALSVFASDLKVVISDLEGNKGDSDEPEQRLMPQITLPVSGLGSLKVSKVPLPAGTYQLAFSIFDVVGNDAGTAVELPGR